MSERDLFIAGMKITEPAQRSAWLDRECGGDAALRQRIDVLLQAFDKAGSLLENPVVAVGSTIDESIREGPGTVIGPYKLLEHIGEGGFGVVFMAEQVKPMRRKVAFKVLKPGMDTRQVVARFEAERQALALMDHPNIAHVFDGGETQTGRPYFVMELVRGIPITEFCDQNCVPVRERLELFVTVCQAVQHAHQKGIIHRDLKPSNVMVTMHDDTPVVKVIDFGIAKATGQQLTEKTLFTNFAQMIGTPLYMSPEQAHLSGLDVDTRSDIYSLGVLLYELLTGTTPFDQARIRTAAYDEILRIIREEDPPRPSTRLSTLGQAAATTSANRKSDPERLSQLVRGELDWIVMKSLEKDRNRRYETVNGLARDVERYLQDEPVQACPPTVAYRFSKFARRNKAPLLAGALIALALVAGTLISTWQAIRATRAEGLAETRLEGETLARRDADDALGAEKLANEETSRTLKREQQSLYFQQIARADLEWWNNNVSRADKILDECLEEHRDWEWRYLKRLCHPEFITFTGHTAEVARVTFSPDGRRLASVSEDKTVRIWDLATGKEIRKLPGHRQDVLNVAWSPDGRRLASGSGRWEESKPGELKVWDAKTGEELLNLSGHRLAVGGVAFSPDNKRLASADWDGAVRMWDLATGQQVRTMRGHRSAVKCIAFSPDGKRLASGGYDRSTIIWDAASGRPLQTLVGHEGDVLSVAFSPDGQRLVSGSWDHTVRIWETTTGKETLPTPAEHADVVWGVDFSPDGKRVASASSDGQVKVWDATSGQELATLRGHTGEVSGVAFSPVGKFLASAGRDQTIKVWDDLTAGRQGRTILSGGGVHMRLALSPDGQHLALGGLFEGGSFKQARLRICDVVTGRETLQLSERPVGFHAAAFSIDGRRLAADWDTMVKIWDAQTGKEVSTLAGHTGLVTSVAFSPDRRRLASGSADKTIKLWDETTGKELLSLSGHSEAVTSVAFSRNGQRLASGSKDHTVKVWDVTTGRELFTLTGHDAPISDVVFSPIGELVASASADRTVRVWDSITGHAVRPLPDHTGKVTAVAFSPDGRRLASASADGNVRLWDLASGQEALAIRGQFNYVYGVAFSPDGERLIASGAVRGVGEGFKVWETQESSQDRPAHRADVLKADARSAGDIHNEKKRWDKAVVAYTTAIDLGLSDPQVWFNRGTAYGMLGKYKNAAEDFAQAVKEKPGEPEFWYCHAMARFGADDLEGCRRVCAGMYERFANTKDPVAAARLVHLFVLVAEAGASTADVVQWSKVGVDNPKYARLLGHALYRDGQFDAAVRHFQELAKTNAPWIDDELFLAMAQHKLGRVDEARATLARAGKRIDDLERSVAGGDYWSWYDRIVEHRLHKEAKALFESK